jgi:hypothetical protein
VTDVGCNNENHHPVLLVSVAKSKNTKMIWFLKQVALAHVSPGPTEEKTAHAVTLLMLDDLSLLQEMSKIMQENEGCEPAAHIATLADKAFKGLLAMPDDLRPDPTTMHHTIARLKACLPETSVFETVAKTREDLNLALEQYSNSGLLRK